LIAQILLKIKKTDLKHAAHPLSIFFEIVDINCRTWYVF